MRRRLLEWGDADDVGTVLVEAVAWRSPSSNNTRGWLWVDWDWAVAKGAAVAESVALLSPLVDKTRGSTDTGWVSPGLKRTR